MNESQRASGASGGSTWRKLALTFLLVPALASGQALHVERDKVLARIGTAETVDISLGPIDGGVGRVFTHEITRTGAHSLRLRFAITQAAQNWAILVRAKANGPVVWSTWDGASDMSTSFWSGVIEGTRAVVEVVSTQPNNALGLKVDRIVAGTDNPVPVSIMGANQLTSIVSADDWIVALGRSVARLRFVSDDGAAYVCTAFLVSRDLMLTNEHCIASDSERASALIDFDFDKKDAPLTQLRLRQLVSNDVGLDYALVRLETPVERAPLTLSAARPTNQQATLIIQHPAGEPKQLSLKDCKVSGAQVPGRANQPTDFGHTCDTLGGSSGSPVFNLDTRQVAGLHHLGVPEGSTNMVNRATHIDLVLDHLQPDVRAEIVAP